MCSWPKTAIQLFFLNSWTISLNNILYQFSYEEDAPKPVAAKVRAVFLF